MCKDCHSARDVGRFTDDIVNNKGSHPIGLTYVPGGNYIDPAPTLSNTQVGLVSGKIECSSCHSVHNATTTDGNLLRETMTNATCMECHNYQAHQGFSCLDCHQMHNTNNIMLIKNQIDIDLTAGEDLRTVVFNSQGTTATPVQAAAKSFADGDGVYDGICEVCHTNNPSTYHYNTSAGDHTHNAGKDCTSCHPHRDPDTGTSFPNGSCHACHEDAAGPQQYPTTGAHEAHAGTLYGYTCSECHWGHGSGGANEPSHSSGTVDVVFNPTGLASRFGQDITLGFGTPTWNSGTKTCSNIYCHSNGFSSYRGSVDGSNSTGTGIDWSGTKGPQTPTYVTTPPWTGTLNKNPGVGTGCDTCHPGPTSGGGSGPVVGIFTPPYLITASTAPQTRRPNTREHNKGAHSGNSEWFYDNPTDPKAGTAVSSGWPTANSVSVQCFWCHNVEEDTNPVNATAAKYQGTYGTRKHVDGKAWFNPWNFDPANPTTNPINTVPVAMPNQGTMAPGLDRGSLTHCGASQSCW
jgi:predicted CxxxxCH...CXXCH cytochrome family protein